MEFSLPAGNKRVALFLSRTAPEQAHSLNVKYLTEELLSNTINCERLVEYVTSLLSQGMCGPTHCLRREFHSPFFNSLTAIGAASELYREWPEATVKLKSQKGP